MKRYGYIYKITSPTGKVYIGQTVDFNGRMVMHKSLSKKPGCKLYNSINKHGWDNHTIEILVEGGYSKDKLNDLEIGYIQKFNSFKKGLNMTLGGDGIWGFSHSDEFKEAHRKRMTKEGNPFFGKKHTEETKAISRIRGTGKTLSKESRIKVGLASKGNNHALGYTHTEEELKKMSIASKGNKHRAGKKQGEEEKMKRINSQLKPIYCGLLGIRFNSVNDCANYFGLNNSSICCMLSGIVKNRYDLKRIVEPKVKCKESGKAYLTIRDAAKDIGIREALLNNYLNGKRYNRTSLYLIKGAA